MPSKAALTFTSNSKDIQRLFAIYATFPGQHKRTKKLEVLNKAAIVLITAVWEVYCEDLVAEVVEHFANYADAPSTLPVSLRRRIANDLKKDPHELAMWGLADGGWRQMLIERVRKQQGLGTWGINTPKSSQVAQFFERETGFENVTASWAWEGMPSERAAEVLDEFIALRGAIAHRAVVEERVFKTTVKNYFRHVAQLVKRTDEHVELQVGEVVPRPFTQGPLPPTM